MYDMKDLVSGGERLDAVASGGPFRTAHDHRRRSPDVLVADAGGRSGPGWS